MLRQLCQETPPSRCILDLGQNSKEINLELPKGFLGQGGRPKALKNISVDSPSWSLPKQQRNIMRALHQRPGYIPSQECIQTVGKQSMSFREDSCIYSCLEYKQTVRKWTKGSLDTGCLYTSSRKRLRTQLENTSRAQRKTSVNRPSDHYPNKNKRDPEP